MDSVDDSTVVTPAETSNLSTPDSSSSEVSQPTVKLRVNEQQNRKIQHETFADGEERFLLDTEGCRLVETTGRTAQRVRASIRHSSRLNKKLNQPPETERTRLTEYSWQWLEKRPRKSRSATSFERDERKANRGLKKRHSYGIESSRRSWDKTDTVEIPKRYSAGDYLRQQILEDLSSNEIIGKTDDQIAEDRCIRVKAYLRRRQENSTYVPPKARLEELKIRWQSERSMKNYSSTIDETNRRNDFDRIRSYLREKIQSKMDEEEWRSSAMRKETVDLPNELDMEDIRKRYSKNGVFVNYQNCTTRKFHSDARIMLEPASSESGNSDEKIIGFSLRHRKTVRNDVKCCRRTRSEVIPETVIDPDDNEVRKRFYSYSAGGRNSWKTRSGLTFEKKLSLPSECCVNPDSRNDFSPDEKRNDWQYVWSTNERDAEDDSNKTGRKYCRRTRSDTLAETLIKTPSGLRKTKRRSVSWSDKRKLHRRSYRYPELDGDTSLDSERDSKNQQAGSLCSWREYKEKRRQDRVRKELAKDAEDRAYSTEICETPRAWMNLREITAKILEDSQVPLETEISKKNENSIDTARTIGETTEDTETETILQENYLLLERDETVIADFRSPNISKLQVNEYRNENDSLPNEFNTIDVGYDTIPKQRRGPIGWIEFNANSNVKKSNTFKVVDGSDDAIDYRCQQRIDMYKSIANTNSWPSKDAKSSSFGRAIIGTSDDANSVAATFNRRQSVFDDEKTSVFTVATVSDTASRSNKDIARDYFRRVYELLKQRQEESRREIVEVSAVTGHDGDTSSSNSEQFQEARKRRRRRKKDRAHRGEELVTVSPGTVENDGWGVQRLLVDSDPSNIIFRRPQLQNVTGNKRPRHPAPPIPANCKINAKDISKYFDYPNKENSPRNCVNENTKSGINDENENEMGSNLSRHNGKGLTGRRTQSSGNLCDPKGKLNNVGKILVPCSSSQRERYKICGSLPNHLDDKEILDDEDTGDNNNVISDTLVGNLGGTLPHKKRTLGVHFSDTGPTGALDLVKHRSQDSLEGDPWRYQDGADLDLVRCKHGNLDLVRKNQSVDVVDGDTTGRRYGTVGRSSNSKCNRGTDLDLVGTLPKRRVDESKGAVLRQSFEARQNRSAERLDGDLLIKMMHKPDCELMKHRQFDRIVDLKLSRLASGEPQDQGYASERSPEDEHPPSLPGQAFPNVTPESTFRVTLQKSSRGLGLSVSGGGTAGPVRVKRLFPQQPAALSNKLQPGDILLAANGVPLTGLTNYEALEVLRTTPNTVELVVCRLPGDTSISPPGAPPPPPARREPPAPLRILNPLPPLQIEPCGEFDIEMTKVAGSLGFTLRKVDSSALGHYVRALVREPALSDGRIQPGDKIVAVDGAPLSPMSHEEAVALLRQCGPRVQLRLYRDLAQTPVSALSPTEPDHPLRPPRTSLRQEAVDMLCDLAVRKLSPGASNGSGSRQTSAASCHSPRRLRKPLSRTPTADNDNENHLTFHPVHPPTANQIESSDAEQCSINTQATDSQTETPSNDIIDPPPLYDFCDSSDSSKPHQRPSFLNLSAPPEKPHFQFSLESESDYTGPMIVTESDSNLTAEYDYEHDLAKDSSTRSNDGPDNDLPSEPASMPPLLSATRTTSGVFSYKNPAYQSANPTCGGIDNSAKNKAAHSSDQDIPGKVLGTEDPVGSKGLLKWKGVMFAPNDRVDETNGKPKTDEAENEISAGLETRHVTSEDGNEVFMVELTRGWNSRLGFSLQPEGNSTVISVVHPDSVAAKDGRLKQGDVLIMVNDESVENMPTAEIIDLLRKIRGSIGITVMRTNKNERLS